MLGAKLHFHRDVKVDGKPKETSEGEVKPVDSAAKPAPVTDSGASGPVAATKTPDGFAPVSAPTAKPLNGPASIRGVTPIPVEKDEISKLPIRVGPEGHKEFGHWRSTSSPLGFAVAVFPDVEIEDPNTVFKSLGDSEDGHS
jgi:hypothetical protein